MHIYISAFLFLRYQLLYAANSVRFSARVKLAIQQLVPPRSNHSKSGVRYWRVLLMTDGQKILIVVTIAFFLCGFAGLIVVAHTANQLVEIVATGVAATPTPQ